MKHITTLVIIIILQSCTYKGIDFTGELSYCEQRGEQISDNTCATVTASPSAYENEPKMEPKGTKLE